ncbi:hypothetical protein F441_22066 [Phytophthora nicotianae CJ01A1]|uniref:Uncharacterized protein n=3 Tax=Phytophthora nicotianae TaxID=4792 RepID=V9DVN4_PHYNI|nr:hypothetical protein F443_22163 [Phytophthora nicotianae P1569]ETK71124.1 hypothetical protein L915_21562 [Phytophthora nicotianae]ETL24573.1 hypothetical protein L916_21428 [Phytophthora nicotianae]ETM31059.1 hypothetical protein L914_21283 [Phytophthora nicotianae]ETP00517.1 hypothetical protein F441_22066 [Phytophthora nicotianae CJ01A1]
MKVFGLFSPMHPYGATSSLLCYWWTLILLAKVKPGGIKTTNIQIIYLLNLGVDMLALSNVCTASQLVDVRVHDEGSLELPQLRLGCVTVGSAQSTPKPRW